MKFRTCALIAVICLMIALPAYAEVIDKPVTKLEILNNPSHYSEIGQPPDLEGLKVKVTFIDGEEYVATAEDFTVERYDNNQEGSQLVALRYGKYPVQVALTVLPSKVRNVDFRLENKARFVGDSVSKDDFTVTVYYESGRKEEVNDFTLNKTLLDNDMTVLRLTWGEFSQDLTVYAQRNTLVDLQVKEPGKSEFRIDEEFSTEGLEVVATYKNGFKEDVTGRCDIEPPDMSYTHDTHVFVKFDGRETSYLVHIAEFKFDHVDVSEYYESGIIYLYFKDKKEPIPVKDTILYSDDYEMKVRTFTVNYNNEVYTVEDSIPEEDMRFIGHRRVRAQVPIGITVTTDESGILGYVQKTELQNVGDTDVRLNISMSDKPEQLSGVPQTVTLALNKRTAFVLDVRHEKAYSEHTEYFRPFNVTLEVPHG